MSTDWLDVSDVTPRIAYTATASQTAFVIPFIFFDDSDLVVYQNAALLTLATDYTVTGAEDEDGGTLTLLTGATVGDEIMIVREIAYVQTTHIPPSGPLDVPAINIQFSKFVAMIQQIANFFMRSIHFPDNDSTLSGELAAPATRANRLLGFDSDGAIVYAVGPTYVGETATGVATVDSRATAQVTVFDASVNLVITGGYASVADGGGAIYKPGAGSGSFTDGGGSTWSLDLSHNIANVMAFGAKGDGTTDDSTAVQAAITAAGARGVVWCPGKDFKIVTGLTVANHRVRFCGAGKDVTKLIFVPTADGSLLTVSMGATLGVRGGVYNLTLYTTDTTYTKIALNIVDRDLFEVQSVAINGSSGWHGGTGSIGLKTSGRDLTGFSDLDITADWPIYLAKNPNLAGALSADHYHFHNCLLSAMDATKSVVEVEDGAVLSNLTFSGYQAWTGGKAGFRFVQSTTVGVAQQIAFNNVRMEQAGDATGFGFDIQPNAGVQSITFTNCSIGDRQGWKLRNCQNATIIGSMNTYVGVGIDADSTNASVEWINTFFQVGVTATLTGLYKQDAKPSNAGNSLPFSAKYLNALATNELGVPLSSSPVSIANNGTAAVPGTTGTTTAAVVISTSLGTSAIFMLNGGNHNTSEVSDPTATFSVTAATATSTNVYWSAGNARYEIENKSGGAVTYTFTLLGRSG